MTRPRADDEDELAGEIPAIQVHLDELLSQRGMTLTELAARVDLTIANLSILKNGRARAIRFTTMARLCEVLRCQPGDLLSYQPVTQSSRCAGLGPKMPVCSGNVPADGGGAGVQAGERQGFCLGHDRVAFRG